jgi:hypothetical protein
MKRVLMIKRTHVSEKTIAWLFMAPALLGLALFILAPFILAIVLSFTNVRLGSPLPVEWTGWREYARLMDDAAFLHALFNNLVFALVVVPVQTLSAPARAGSVPHPVLHAGDISLVADRRGVDPDLQPGCQRPDESCVAVNESGPLADEGLSP